MQVGNRMDQNYIDWKPEYDFGIEDIDNQHKYFAHLINRLSEELKNINSQDHAASIVSELNAYAHFHFISEENIMRNAGYPNLEEHKILHLQLLDELNTEELILDHEFSQQKATEIIQFLTDWFLSHTLHEDRLYADYICGTQNSKY